MIPPNYTQAPNVFFDEMVKTLSEGELRVCLVIIRQTFGWHKAYDRISLTQLAEKTGMERKSISRCLNSLISRGIVQKKKFGDKGKERCYFSLIMVEPEEDKIDDGEISEEEMDIISNNYYQRPKDTPPVSQGHPPQCPKDTHKRNSSKETIQNNKQQAVVFFDNENDGNEDHPKRSIPKKVVKEEPKIPEVKKIFECLEKVDIPLSEKQWLTDNHDEDAVKNAIDWATNPQTTIRTTLVQGLKWACSNKPEIPKNPIEEFEANKSYAKKHDGIRVGCAWIEALSKNVEIIFGGCQATPIVIGYEEKAFVEKFHEALRKNNFKPLTA